MPDSERCKDCKWDTEPTPVEYNGLSKVVVIHAICNHCRYNYDSYYERK